MNLRMNILSLLETTYKSQWPVQQYRQNGNHQFPLQGSTFQNRDDRQDDRQRDYRKDNEKLDYPNIPPYIPTSCNWENR